MNKNISYNDWKVTLKTDENGIKMIIKYKLERCIGVKRPITVLY